MMTDQELGSKIKQAFEHATPNVLDSVLDNCQGQKGKVITMTNKKKKPWIGRIAAIAAALALVIGLGLGYAALNPKDTPSAPVISSTILLDVNPSVELTVNAEERVTGVTALNADAESILDGMDLKDSDLDVAVNAIIGSMLRKGYLTERANSILVSVSSTDAATGVALQEKLTADVNELLSNQTFNGAVISQTVSNSDELKAIADENQISIGKAKLIQRIIAQNTRYTFDELAALSINELNLLTESGSLHLNDVISSGAASETSYIGAEAAKTIALENAGVTEADIRNLEIDLDLEKGIMVYEIEFDTAAYEFEYDINATTGQIVWSEKDVEREDDGRPVETPPATTPSTDPGSDPVIPSEPTIEEPTLIGKEAALNAAYAHAGISADSATAVECELDRDHGGFIYEIEFRSGEYEYEYDINAETGAVIKYEKDRDDDAPVTPPVSTPTYIDEDAAKAVALAHAGVDADAIRDYDCELDTAHGKAYYEIDFEAGNIDYEYKIDASNGTVLRFEKDTDDDDDVPTVTPTEPSAPAPAYIGKEAAKAAALAHAGVDAETIRDYDCELDTDDGAATYEIDFEANGYEYEYEIDATSGTVLRSNKEPMDDDDDDDTPVVAPTYIGKEAAKAAALAHAGVDAEAIRDYGCELDTDDGTAVYEIEFTAAGIDYEYEIDAVTGSVLRCDRETDD